MSLNALEREGLLRATAVQELWGLEEEDFKGIITIDNLIVGMLCFHGQ